MDKNSKIYIAGHTGLVGSAILRGLQADGYQNLVYRTSRELDLTDALAVGQFFAQEQPEYVFLAAAKVGGIKANNIYRADFLYTNLQIQNNVIHQSYVHKVKKLLFLGSSCIYPKNAPQPLKEDYLLTSELEYTNEPYAIAKIAGIKLCESYNIQYKTNFIAVMPTNLYGINDNFDLEKSHVLPAMIRKFYLAKLLQEQNYVQIAHNLQLAETDDTVRIMSVLAKYGIIRNNEVDVTVRLWGSGKPYREFLHVDDMANACVFVMNNIDFPLLAKDHTEIRNTHINIGTGTDLTIAELAAMVAQVSGFTGKIAFEATHSDGTLRKLLDVSKLATLGWGAKIKLADGIAAVVRWYQESNLNI